MPEIDSSFDLLDTPKHHNIIPLNDRNILSLLKSPPEDIPKEVKDQETVAAKDKNKTHELNAKKSYGLLETQKENNFYDSIPLSLTHHNNNHKITKEKKRYISDISVYTDLNTDSLINNNTNMSSNNTFLKNLPLKILKNGVKKDSSELILSSLGNQTIAHKVKNKKVSDLLVLGHQNGFYISKECRRKTEKFNKHLKENKADYYKPRCAINSRPQILNRNMKRKTILKRSYDINSDVLFQDDEDYDKELKNMMKSLDFRIKQNGKNFDITLKNTLYNIFKK